MAKIYSKETSNDNKKVKPKAETIDFILNYSRSLSILKTDKFMIEINKN
ncbi:hypothetical protein [Aquimarina agarilytica]|nr:hypothetical protein [Aquimarina agarilytica]